jgi:hypothetical protein
MDVKDGLADYQNVRPTMRPYSEFEHTIAQRGQSLCDQVHARLVYVKLISNFSSRILPL